MLDHLHSRIGLRYGLRRFSRFADLSAALARGEIDLAMATASTRERERSFAFRTPYAQVRQALVPRADETATTLAPDLAGRRLAVSAGEVSEARARALSRRARGGGGEPAARAGLARRVPGRRRAGRAARGAPRRRVAPADRPARAGDLQPARRRAAAGHAARRRWLAFVGPFRREPLVLLSHRGSGPASLVQCAGGRLALPAGHWGRVLVEARHPNIELVSCAEESDCAARVAAGRAEATLVQLSRRGAGGSRADPAGLAVTGVVEELRAEEFIALRGSRRERVPRAAAQAAAEEASAARERYLSFLAHEVRNTLGGITGAVRLLEERHDADFAERLLPSLHRSAAGTLQLLDDLLDQGRLDAGHLPLWPVRCDFGALARAVVEELQPAAAAKGLRLGVRGGGPAEEVLHELDPLRVSQIVRNLVANAVKYTPTGEVEVSWDRTPRGDGRDELRLLVRDTGAGIAPEDRERLFRAYAQVGRGHPGGAGLGLALSRPLAEPMGGTIAFDSEPGRGSLFRFLVPAPRSAAVTPA